jgi:hypothetical protein
MSAVSGCQPARQGVGSSNDEVDPLGLAAALRLDDDARAELAAELLEGGTPSTKLQLRLANVKKPSY